jgi:hypothetical protein
MPRINIDEKFLTDPRFEALVEELSDKDTAIGVCVRLWMLAQKYYVPDLKPIPDHIIGLSKLPIAILEGCHLVKREGSDWFACGSDEQFAWLLRSYENGRKSAEARKSKVTIVQPPPNDSGTTSSSSSSSSSSYKEKKKGTGSAKASPTNLLKVQEHYASKYHPDHLAHEFEKCREYHYAKSGTEITLRHMSTWLNTEWGKKSWEAFQISKGLKQDPLIEYFQQVSKEQGWEQ